MTKEGKIKILDAPNNKAMVNAVVEVTFKNVMKGHVELKVYNPSINKKKGATIEIRKMPDYEYLWVERLRDILINLLERFIDGEVLETASKGLINSVPGRVTSKPKLFCAKPTK